MIKKTIIKILKKNKYTRNFCKKLISIRNTYRYQTSCKKNVIDDKMIIFESFMGRKYADSPKAIYEELIKSDKYNDYTFVWCFKKPEDYVSNKVLNRAVLVKYRSKKFYEMYSKAKYIVSNSRIDQIIKIRDGQVYVQTWHGTPLKRLGYDIEIGDNALHTQDELCKMYKLDAERYTYLISPSKFCSDKLTSAFNLPVNNPDVKIIEKGYPRNDYLVNYTLDDVSRIKNNLNIQHIKKKIILYAPTWRDNQYTDGSYSLDLGINFDLLKEKLSNDYIILFRAHYFVADNFNFTDYKDFIFDVSSYDDINDLYIVSDLLITDYSSVFFDFAILKKPIYFYMYDLNEYQDVIRGFYISLKELPGPIVENENDLIAALNKPFVYDERYKQFNLKFNPLDDGKASQRVVEEIFG